MSDMKMSDVFELPVYSGMKAATKASAIYDASGTFGILNNQAMRHVAHAINNHDRLEQENKQLIETGHKANKDLRNDVNEIQQENAELREALQKTINLSERFVVNALTLAKHDYPLSPSAGIQLKDWKVHEQRIQSLLSKND
ncbi:coil containing protein [Vibrio phage 1.042.O._10N.286.45.B8]|nr:coil containing protein [Vibrio phage 1.042.O._10N.286.45.B8]